MFTLTHSHKFASITELENMIPFERDIYVDMLKAEMKLKEDQMRTHQQMQEALRNRRF